MKVLHGEARLLCHEVDTCSLHLAKGHTVDLLATQPDEVVTKCSATAIAS